jgi:hypothetical protein
LYQNEHNAVTALHGSDKESRRQPPILTREKKTEGHIRRRCQAKEKKGQEITANS